MLTFHGQPKTVHVVHSFGERTVLDRSGSFTYSEHRPNGPECEPVCQSAGLEWSLP